MPNRFIPVADDFFASPQISLADIEEAARIGVTLIINNRPDGEEPGQIAGAEIEAAARAAGLDYVAFPVGAAGISEEMLDKFLAAVRDTEGAALGYCKSGMRSAALRAFALARAGASIDDILSQSAAAGFDLRGHRAMLEAFAGQ